MQNFITKAYLQYKSLFDNERGSQSLEWIAIAAVVVIITGLISQQVSSMSLGETFVGKISNWIEKIGQDGW